MSRVTKEALYDLFRNYDKPDEIDFQSLIDECYNENGTATMDEVRAYVASAITESEAAIAETYATKEYVDEAIEGIDITIGEDLTTNVDCGGILSGTAISGTTSVVEVVKNMLYTYKKPSCSITGGGNMFIGSSNTVIITYTATDSMNSHLNKVELYKGNTLVETKTTAGTYTETFENVTSDTTWTVKVYETGKSATAMESASTAVKFYYKCYYGTSDTIPTTVPTTGGVFFTGNTLDLKSKMTWDKLCFWVMVKASNTADASVVTSNNETITVDKATLTGVDGGGNAMNYTMLYKKTDTLMGTSFNKLTITK